MGKPKKIDLVCQEFMHMTPADQFKFLAEQTLKTALGCKVPSHAVGALKLLAEMLDIIHLRNEWYKSKCNDRADLKQRQQAVIQLIKDTAGSEEVKQLADRI